jgi:hypothetical protein
MSTGNPRRMISMYDMFCANAPSVPGVRDHDDLTNCTTYHDTDRRAAESAAIA